MRMLIAVASSFQQDYIFERLWEQCFQRHSKRPCAEKFGFEVFVIILNTMEQAHTLAGAEFDWIMWHDNARYFARAGVYEYVMSRQRSPSPLPNCARPTGPVIVDMILHCPECKHQHIDKADDKCRHPNYNYSKTGPYCPDCKLDAADFGTHLAWTNPPHKSHLCSKCGCIWRPADVYTNGVEKIQTKGKADTVVYNGS